jgi:beta-ureidopropionase
LPEKELKEVKRILYGNEAKKLVLPEEAINLADKHNFDIAGYYIHAHKEQLRPPRIVRVGAV